MSPRLIQSLLIFIFCFLIYTTTNVLGQVSGVQRSPYWRSITDTVQAENPAADLDQCANGGVGSVPVECTGAAWQNGNLNQNQAHYLEGESVAYRMRFSSLAVGGTYTVTIEWDTTENAKHALDYVTSFDDSEMNADPCSGVAGCFLASHTEFLIPVDANVTAGFDGVPATGDDITQRAGVFTLYGGTISGVSGYTRSGTYAGSSHTSIVITFQSNASNPVLAWGGHISTRVDWGVNNSAIAIAGSPFHMRLLDLNGAGGNQDRGLSSGAAVFPGSLTVIKLVANGPAFSSSQMFDFSISPILGSGFSLTDTNTGQFLGGSRTFSGVTAFDTDLTVTESPVIGWSLSDLACSIQTGGGTAGTFSTNMTLRSATVNLKEGNSATCTFSNLQLFPTAAPVSVSGRVVSSYGYGIGKALITVTNMADRSRRTVLTNPFGYYMVEGFTAGDFVMIGVTHKSYSFVDHMKAVTLYEDITDMNFVANP